MSKSSNLVTLKADENRIRETFEQWGTLHGFQEYLTPMFKSIGADGYHLQLPAKLGVPGEARWWFACVYLLGVGLGWNDIGLGLKVWREEGYPESHPILKLVKESFGPEVECLEIWARYNSGPREVFSSFAVDERGNPMSFRQPDSWEPGEVEEQVRNLEAKITAESETRAFESFVSWLHSDSMHIGHHLEISAADRGPRIGSLAEAPLTSQTPLGSLTIVTLPNMFGFLDFLRASTAPILSTMRSGERAKLLVEVESPSLLIPMQYMPLTGRWYWHEITNNDDDPGPEIWGSILDW